jgi:hypothetical protein
VIRQLESFAEHLPKKIAGIDGHSYTPEELIIEAIIAITLAKAGNHLPFDRLFDNLGENQELLIKAVEGNNSILSLLRAEIERERYQVVKKNGQLEVIDLTEQQKPIDPRAYFKVLHRNQIVAQEIKYAEFITHVHLTKVYLVKFEIFELLVRKLPNLETITLDSSINELVVTPEIVGFLKENGVELDLQRGPTLQLAG